MLKIKKEIAVGLQGNFRVTVNSVNRFHKAEINQVLFDKIYGEGVVKSEVSLGKK